METDADRLAEIQALGGVSVRVRGAEFLAIFDAEFVEVLEGMESTAPALSACRSSDLTRVELNKKDAVDIGGQTFTVRRIEHDGTGMAIVRLGK